MFLTLTKNTCDEKYRLAHVTQHPSRTDGGLKPVVFMQGLLSKLNRSATVLEYFPLSLPCSAQVVLAIICTI